MEEIQQRIRKETEQRGTRRNNKHKEAKRRRHQIPKHFVEVKILINPTTKLSIIAWGFGVLGFCDFVGVDIAPV